MLRLLVNQIKDSYDYIVIDCMPSLFAELAKNANAIRKVKGRNLVHIPTLEEYIETMCVE